MTRSILGIGMDRSNCFGEERLISTDRDLRYLTRLEDDEAAGFVPAVESFLSEVYDGEGSQ
jgi:hypothetical protein